MVILFSLALIFLIGSVCAADVNETSLEEPSIDEVNDTLGVVSTDESSQALQNASFSEVSKSSYIPGNTFVVYLLDGQGKAMNNASVYLKVDGNITKVNTDKNGAVKLKLNLSEGRHKIYFNFNVRKEGQYFQN